MNIKTQKEIEAMARREGFSAYNARVASAIAMCEAPYMKGGVAYADCDAVGDQTLANATWGYSYGAFQIRSLRSDKGTGRIRDEERLIEPEFNISSARSIKLAAGSWRPWSTFTGGQYKAYLQDLFPPPLGSYVVVNGDSLSKIAIKVSKGEWSWPDLAAANGIVPPYTINIGQVLLLPFDKIGA